MTYFSEDFFTEEFFPRSKCIPFGELLEALFFQPRSDNEDFPIHGPNVIRFSSVFLGNAIMHHPLPPGMAGLLKLNTPQDVDQIQSLLAQSAHNIQQCMETVGGRGGDKEEEFLRICALYHDLGKVIRRANHPQIGTNLLRNSQLEETRKLIEILKRDDRGSSALESAENRFARLASVLQHHDKFGVVSTGEGGLPIFSDLPYFRSDSSKIAGIQKNVTTVMLLNLADIAAVNVATGDLRNQSLELARKAGEARAAGDADVEQQALKALVELCRNPNTCKGLDLQVLTDVLGDWRTLTQAVEVSQGDRGALKKRLLELEQNPSRAITRILRMLKAASTSSEAADLAPHFSLTSVESVLVGALGSHQLQSFCDQLASVVKFDYGLGFFQALVCGCVRRQLNPQAGLGKNLKRLAPEEVQALRETGQDVQREIAQTATERIIQVIKGLLGRYVGVLGSLSGTGRRFGFQMQTLSNDLTILRTIMDFLCMKDKEFVAVTWIADEVSLWSLD